MSCRLSSSQVYLLVNLFSKLYAIVILQWIAFIFGGDGPVGVSCERETILTLFVMNFSEVIPGLPFS